MKTRDVSLLIGATGLIGYHLAHYLDRRGEKVVATFRGSPRKLFSPQIRLVRCDVTERDKFEALIRRLRPARIYFLSAQSSVRVAWFEPVKTIQVNFLGGVYLLETLRQLGLKSRVMVFSTGTTYGLSHELRRPLTEEVCQKPKDPYSVSKLAVDMFARLYAKVHGLPVVVVRLANLVGKGQALTFSLANFAHQIAGIEMGRLPARIQVGNISTMRDYLDVRDGVRAIELLMRRGLPGEVYNVASGKSRRLSEVLNTMLGISRLDARKVRIVKKKTLASKDEIKEIRLNPSKLKKRTGWRPRIRLEETLEEILIDARRRFDEN